MSRTLAVPAAGTDLDAPAAIALPHAPYILLVDEETGTFEAHPNPAARAKSHFGMVVAKWVLNRKVDVVIGHHMGPHPAISLEEAGIPVYESVEGLPVREVLARFHAGELAVLSRGEISQRHDAAGGGHHHHGHGHGHHHH